MGRRHIGEQSRGSHPACIVAALACLAGCDLGGDPTPLNTADATDAFSDAGPMAGADAPDVDADAAAVDAGLDGGATFCACEPPQECFEISSCTPPSTCTYVGRPEGTPCEGGTCSDGECVPFGTGVCGDGVRGVGDAREACDDGNPVSTDSCTGCVPQVFDVSATPADGVDFPPGARTGVGVDGAGRALYVWTAALTTGAGAEVRARAYGANGAVSTMTALIVAADLGVGVDPHPTVAGLTTGGWVVAWEDRGIDTSDLGIAYRIVRADGTMGSAQRANTTTLLRQHQPSLASTATGFLAAWTDDSALLAGGGSQIVVRHFPTGARPSAEVMVSDGLDASEPSLAIDETGRVLVAYTDLGIAPSFARVVHGRVLIGVTPTPAVAGPSFEFDSPSSDSHSPSAAAFATGFVVAWGARDRDGSGDIRARTVSGTGVLGLVALDTGVPVPSPGDEVAETEPSIATFPDGSSFLVTHSIGREDTGGIVRVVGAGPPEVVDLDAALGERTVGDISVAGAPDGIWVSFGRAGHSPVGGPIRAVYGYLLPGS